MLGVRRPEHSSIMTILAGADGCKDGWIVAIDHPESGETSCQVVSSIGHVLEKHPYLTVLAIDVPIGLPDHGPRTCDIKARAMLGRPRGSGVFPAPIRSMIDAATYSQACLIGRHVDGRALTIQCWNILPKIREVDTYLRNQPVGNNCIREVHPEVSFLVLAGRPMKFPKRTRAGRNERIALLEPIFGEAVPKALRSCRQMGAQPDDALDAFVALWSARRIHCQSAMVLPIDEEIDSEGLKMEILA